MKKLTLLCCFFILVSASLFASATNKFNLMIAPASLTANSITLLWDKQANYTNAVYEISINGKVIGPTSKTNYTVSNLLPNVSYIASIKVKQAGNENNSLNTLKFKTTAKGKIFNILNYGAKSDSITKNTKAIQDAINACTAGGTVYIPKGNFVSGALFLKSDMTLYIEKGGVLKGSSIVEDYMPMILNRFEGWELKTYASLLNAGSLNRNGTYNVKNLRITGGGTISGGGRKLGEAMTKFAGLRSRGRLICLINCQDVCLSNLTVTEPPSWTVHYIYSDNITCHDLNIVTANIRNGDGIDPDSSTGSYIFNCTFNTGDDCIAIKSGKNPEGFFVAKPTKNVRITDCDFVKGHGISIGSEMSGGVSDVLVQDCKAGALLHGMQIKGTKERGGYVKNVTVTDCQLLQITVFSAVNYNNDGEAAPEVPTFENFVFKNIDLSHALLKEATININGFNDPAHYLKNVTFYNIKMPENSEVVINNAEQIKFIDVKTLAGLKPKYTVTNGSNISY